jgi:hemolysin-activating ACP:hemolysin acyltransferase
MVSLSRLNSLANLALSDAARLDFFIGFGARFYSGLEPAISLDSFLNWFVAANLRNQIEVYFDALGRPLGLVIWADADPKNILRKDLASRIESISKTKRGIVLVDVIFKPSARFAMLRAIRDELLHTYGTVFYYRQVSGQKIVRVVETRAGLRTNPHSANSTKFMKELTTDHSLIEQCVSEIQKDRYVGHALRAFGSSTAHRKMLLRSVIPTISAARSTGQATILESMENAPSGLITWQSRNWGRTTITRNWWRVIARNCV